MFQPLLSSHSLGCRNLGCSTTKQESRFFVLDLSPDLWGPTGKLSILMRAARDHTGCFDKLEEDLVQP